MHVSDGTRNECTPLVSTKHTAPAKSALMSPTPSPSQSLAVLRLFLSACNVIYARRKVVSTNPFERLRLVLIPFFGSRASGSASLPALLEISPFQRQPLFRVTSHNDPHLCSSPLLRLRPAPLLKPPIAVMRHSIVIHWRVKCFLPFNLSEKCSTKNLRRYKCLSRSHLCTEHGTSQTLRPLFSIY